MVPRAASSLVAPIGTLSPYRNMSAGMASRASKAIRTGLAECGPTRRLISSTPNAATRNGFRAGVNNLSRAHGVTYSVSDTRHRGVFPFDWDT